MDRPIIETTQEKNIYYIYNIYISEFRLDLSISDAFFAIRGITQASSGDALPAEDRRGGMPVPKQARTFFGILGVLRGSKMVI